MQIKGPEQSVRCFLVSLTLIAIIYVSFLIQVNFASWKFNSGIYESLDCAAEHQGVNRTQMQSMAFSTWSEYNVNGQFRQDVMASEESQLEPANSIQESSSLINGTLACFCDQEVQQRGWLTTVF
jgi:hypothetical protein